ncbi:hypothetical protein HanRHA438_Chr10g0440281 [Helianthus annuus]|nr:hypothetical protein HanRHA438_Chr10g0440281 [Helianthus annuus]
MHQRKAKVDEMEAAMVIAFMSHQLKRQLEILLGWLRINIIFRIVGMPFTFLQACILCG